MVPSKHELPSGDRGPGEPAPAEQDWHELRRGVDRDVRLSRTLNEVGAIPLSAFAVIGVLVDTLIHADDEAGTTSETPRENDE